MRPYLPLLVLLFPLVACAAGPVTMTMPSGAVVNVPAKSANYALYADAMASQARTADAQAAAITAAASNPSCDSQCVTAVAAFAALAVTSGRGQAQIAAPPREPSGMEKFASMVSAMAPMVGTVGSTMVQMKQTEASRDTSLAQYEWLGGLVSSTTGNMAQVAINAAPRIDVGGDYVAGAATVVRGQVGDSAGRDQISGTQYQGPYTGRDSAGRDIANGSTIGSGCTGAGCQPVTDQSTSGD